MGFSPRGLYQGESSVPRMDHIEPAQVQVFQSMPLP